MMVSECKSQCSVVTWQIVSVCGWVKSQQRLYILPIRKRMPRNWTVTGRRFLDDCRVGIDRIIMGAGRALLLFWLCDDENVSLDCQALPSIVTDFSQDAVEFNHSECVF